MKTLVKYLLVFCLFLSLSKCSHAQQEISKQFFNWLRIYNGKLQIKSGSSWTDVGGTASTLKASKLLLNTSVDAGGVASLSGDIYTTGLIWNRSTAASAYGYLAYDGGNKVWSFTDGIRSNNGNYFGATYSTGARLYLDYYGHQLYVGKTPNQNGMLFRMDGVIQQTFNGYSNRAVKMGYTVDVNHTGKDSIMGAHFYVYDNSLTQNDVFGVVAEVTGANNRKVSLRCEGGAILLPRLTSYERDGFPNPFAGLFIYNTTTNKINYHNGSGWREMSDIAAPAAPPLP